MTGHRQDTYTHGHQEAVLRSHRWRTAENSAAYLLGHLRGGDSLLDVGCGPGTVTADLAAEVAPGRVVGLDPSGEVIAQGRAHAADRGLDNLSFVEGDLQQAPLPVGAFDVVHAHQVLQHLREPVDALRRMAELARPGGFVAVRDSDYPAFAWYPTDPRLDAWRRIYLEVSRRNGAHADAGRRLRAWAEQAGLHESTYTSSTWTFSTPEERRWWGESWADRVVESALAEQATAYGIASREELREVAEGWQDWAADPVGVFVVVHGELLARVPGGEGHPRA